MPILTSTSDAGHYDKQNQDLHIAVTFTNTHVAEVSSVILSAFVVFFGLNIFYS